MQQIRILLAAMLWLTLGSFAVRAQCPPTCPPTPDFHSDQWIGPEQTQLQLCVGGYPCTVTVQYCYRRAGGVFNDISITCITVDPACAGNLTVAQVGEAAIQRVMNHRYEQNDPHYQNIPPCPSYATNWRVFTAGCYSRFLIGGNSYYTPCAGTGQCFATYNVCWTESPVGCLDVMVPQIQATKVQSFPTYGCPQWEGGSSNPCYEWCP